MTTRTDTPTPRELMASGQKGGFARALLALYDNPCLKNAARAFQVADNNNRVQVEYWFVRVAARMCGAGLTRRKEMRALLEAAFPGLKRLDEKMADPFSFNLTEEADDGDGI